MAPAGYPPGGYITDYLGFWAVWLFLVASTVFFFRATRGRRGALRLVAGNVLVFVGILWTVVVGGETYLRYVYDQTDSYGLMLTNWSWFGRHVHENSEGFRDREFVRVKPPGTTRVSFVGDSFTMGWGVRDPDHTYPGRIRKHLDARSPGRFDVRVDSQPGWTTTDEMNRVDTISRTESIDRVVIGYCLNDPDNLLPPERWFIRENAPRVPWIDPTRSFVADFLWYRLKLRSDVRVQGFFDYEKEAYDDPAVWARQCEQFRHIADACRAAAIRLDVVVFPFFGSWGADYQFDSCHDRVAQAWKRLGVDVIDLRDAYRGIPAADLVCNRFDSHPNERAHEIAARVVLERAFGVR